MKNRIKKMVTKVREQAWKIALLVGGMMLGVNSVAYATPSPAPDIATEKWNNVIDFILPWIERLGGVVILIGAVEFGLAFKNDDPEGKTKGLRTVIAGAIVLAVGASADIFLF